MNRLFLILFLVSFSLLACNRDKKHLVGSWKLEYGLTSSVTPDTILPKAEETYHFYSEGAFAIDRIKKDGGQEQLEVARGNWEMGEESRDDQEIQFITLREKQLQKIIEQRYDIERLTDDTLIWQDRRKSRYIFVKTEDNF
ncbi:MAG: hypothetical protein ACK4ND_14130 [Cytophagaceae bacterium]